MKSKIFAVYDSKVETYKEPFARRTTGEALRGWEDIVNEKSNPNNMLAKYPGDFTLFEIGEWDDEAGVFTQYQAKKSLGTGLEYQKSAVPLPITEGR